MVKLDLPQNDEERGVFNTYSKVLGSAVNPVLREGNSDRRSSTAVKEHGKRNPHKMMQDWPEISKTRVAHMQQGDFYGSEKSVTISNSGTGIIEFESNSGKKTILKDDIKLVGKVHDYGCRLMQLTYNNQSLLATGCYETIDRNSY